MRLTILGELKRLIKFTANPGHDDNSEDKANKLVRPFLLNTEIIAEPDNTEQGSECKTDQGNRGKIFGYNLKKIKWNRRKYDKGEDLTEVFNSVFKELKIIIQKKTHQ